VTPAQMQELLGLAETFLAPPPRRAAPKPTGSGTAPGATTPRLTGPQAPEPVPTRRVPVPPAP